MSKSKQIQSNIEDRSLWKKEMKEDQIPLHSSEILELLFMPDAEWQAWAR